MTKDEALKLALEALESKFLFIAGDGEAVDQRAKAITAIKEALAQPDKNEFNPDWDTQAVLVEEMQRMAKRIEELKAQPEPWEKFCDSNCVWTDHHPDCKLAQRKPLTDEQINEFFQGMEPNNGFWLSFARAIEAAHGIYAPTERKGEA